jgi:hypothetical protein
MKLESTLLMLQCLETKVVPEPMSWVPSSKSFDIPCIERNDSIQTGLTRVYHCASWNHTFLLVRFTAFDAHNKIGSACGVQQPRLLEHYTGAYLEDKHSLLAGL